MYLHFWDGIFLVFFLALYLFLRHRRRSRSTADNGTRAPTSVMRMERSKHCRERATRKGIKRKTDFSHKHWAARRTTLLLLLVVWYMHAISAAYRHSGNPSYTFVIIIVIICIMARRQAFRSFAADNFKSENEIRHSCECVWRKASAHRSRSSAEYSNVAATYVWVYAIALLWSLRVCIGFGYILKLQNTLSQQQQPNRSGKKNSIPTWAKC